MVLASYFNPIAWTMWYLLRLGGGGYMVPPPWPFQSWRHTWQGTPTP